MSRVEPNRNVYVGHRYVPKIFGEWDKRNEYEGLSIVTYKGNSYTSKKRTPVGIDIENEEYWVITGNYNAQVDYYRDETERVAQDLLLKAEKIELESFKSDTTQNINEFKSDTTKNINEFKSDTTKNINEFKTETNENINEFTENQEIKNTELNRDIEENKNKIEKEFIKQSNNKIPVSNLSTIKNSKALNTFIDDDGSRSVITKLKPLSVKYDIPFTLSIIGSHIENGTGLTLDELLDFQNNHGWEIASHQYDHLELGNVTDMNVIHNEIVYSKEYLRSKGLDVKNMVYPNGQSNKLVREVTSKYYNTGVGVRYGVNGKPSDSFNLRRIPFPYAEANNDFNWYKNLIDTAIQNNEWIVWMLHCGQSNFDNYALNLLDSIISYLETMGVETVNLQEGYERHGNIIDINEEYFMANDGTNNIVNFYNKRLNVQTGIETINGTMKPKDFELMKTVTSLYQARSSSEGLPTNSAGVFTCHMTESVNHGYQTYVSNGQSYIRFVENADKWREWQSISLKEEDTHVTVTPTNIEPGKTVRIPVTNSIIGKNKIHQLTPEEVIPSPVVLSYHVKGDGLMYIHAFNNSATETYEIPTEWTLLTRT